MVIKKEYINQFLTFLKIERNKECPVSLQKNPVKMLEEAYIKVHHFLPIKDCKIRETLRNPCTYSKKRATFIASSGYKKLQKKERMKDILSLFYC